MAKAGSGGAPAASAGAPRTYTVMRPRRIANTTTTTTSAGASRVQNNKKSKYVTLEPHLRTLWMDVRSREMKSSAHMYLKSGSGSVIWWMPTKRLIVTKKNTNWIATASNQSRWKRVRRALTPKSTANHAAMRTTVATSWSASCP